MSALLGSRSLWDVDGAAACGPPRSGVVAPMRRCTTHSMRPLRAAVAWSGIGMRWRRGRLGGPAPRVPDRSSMDVLRWRLMDSCARRLWTDGRSGTRLSRRRHHIRAPPTPTGLTSLSAAGSGAACSEDIRRCHGADLGRRRIGIPLLQVCLIYAVTMEVRWCM